MTDETKPPTKVQAALKLQEIPAEKWQTIARRTFIGTIFFLLGCFFLLLMYRHHQAKQEISLALLIAGVVLASFGAHIFSGQIFAASVLSLAEPLRIIRDFWKGKDS